MSAPSKDLAPYHPDHPEEFIPPFPSLPDEGSLDSPDPSEVLPKLEHPPNPSDLALPPIILGCAPFGYGIYASRDNVLSDLPLRIVRLALRAGINAFDTSPWYHPSEIILGHALRALAADHPRESYILITKAGKYGPTAAGHIYDPGVIRRSVERSLRRLQTDYIDVVYLHDCEFVASPPICPAGKPLDALASPAEHGLAPPFLPRGPGDQAILDSLSTLGELQSEGKIRKVGLAGYPLPALLRLSLLALHSSGRPVDIIQSYAHQTVQNSSLSEGFIAALTEQAKVGQVINAAPLAMGILTRSGGPEWHPIRGGAVWDATRETVKLCEKRGTTIEDVACDFGYRTLRQSDGRVVPVVIGCKNLEEVHLSLKSYRRANEGRRESEVEKEVVRVFEERGVRNVSWQSPPGKG